MKRALLLFAVIVTSACGHPVDVTQAVRVEVVTSGWLPADTGGARNKIVPAVALTLKNVSNETLSALQVNTVFRLVSNNNELGTDFRPAMASGGTPAGAVTPKLMLKAAQGYTGTDPIEDLLTNSHFVDAKVEVFVKAGAESWTRMGEYPIAREFTGS